jgi:MFS transporter, DHA1 family, staphyloferrin A biosynthesis exporter
MEKDRTVGAKPTFIQVEAGGLHKTLSGRKSKDDRPGQDPDPDPPSLTRGPWTSSARGSASSPKLPGGVKPPGGVLDSLRHRDFRWIWISTLSSSMAFNMQILTRGWLVLRLAENSPFALSLVMMSFALPMTIAAPFGGALADRVQRKRMIIVSQSGNALMTLLLATLDFTGWIRFWQLLVFGFINGSLIALNMPSRQAILSEIVPEESLMNAISLNNSAMNLTRILGPALAGILILFLDTAGVFYLIAIAYVFSAFCAGVIKVGGTAAVNPRKSMGQDILDGLSYARGNSTLFGLVIMAILPTLFGFSYFSLLPAWAREVLDVQSDGLGILMMVTGVGALFGSLALASMSRLRGRGGILLAVSAAWGVAIAVFSQATSYGLVLPMLFSIGLMSAVYMSLNTTLLQLYAVPEMRGRVMSLSFMTFGLMPLSSVPFGALAERIGTPNALGLSGILLSAFTVIFAMIYPRLARIS